MSDKSRIQWTDVTWNPTTGCSKVSQGCKHCYALRDWARLSCNPKTVYYGREFTDVQLHPERLEQPLSWRKPRRVFVNSMSDLFHEDVPFEFIASVFAIMGVTTRHTYQILTKRPGRMLAFFQWAHQIQDDDGEWQAVDTDDFDADRRIFSHWPETIPWKGYDNCGPAYPYKNVWLGVSVEDQETADERIPLLIETPAAVRFVSYEPALGPVDLDQACMPMCTHDDAYTEWDTGALVCSRCDEGGQVEALDWVIVGGESGRGARPFDVQWARDTVTQCRAANVPAFVKQLGANVAWSGMAGPDEHWPYAPPREDTGRGFFRVYLNDRKGGDMDEWPVDLRVREFPR